MHVVTIVFLVIFGIGVLLAASEAVRIASYLLISKRMTGSIKKFERLNPAAAKKILFIGDSTGYGTGASHARYSIVGRLGADFPDAHIENCSGSGGFMSKTCQVLQEKAEDQMRYTVVIIMVGGMDLVRCTPYSLVRRMLRNAISYGKRCGREVVLISPNNTGLAPLYRFPLSCIYRERAKRFDALYREVAREEHIHYISLFQEHTDTLSARNLFSPDKTHPNDEGYGLWYNQIKGVIATLLEHHDGTIAG